jgi:hypothetical protein
MGAGHSHGLAFRFRCARSFARVPPIGGLRREPIAAFRSDYSDCQFGKPPEPEPQSYCDDEHSAETFTRSAACTEGSPGHKTGEPSVIIFDHLHFSCLTEAKFVVCGVLLGYFAA